MGEKYMSRNMHTIQIIKPKYIPFSHIKCKPSLFQARCIFFPMYDLDLGLYKLEHLELGVLLHFSVESLFCVKDMKTEA